MLKVSSENSIAFHPGYYVKKYLDNQGMTQRELADRLNTTEKNVSEIVNGKMLLNNPLIEGLSLALGTSSELWENLNASYLNALAEVKKEKQLSKEKVILKKLDYSFWNQMGVVATTTKAEEKVSELKRYLRVSNLSVLENRNFLVQYKTAIKEVKDTNVINSNAWVQTALNIANNKNVQPIDLKYLKSQLPEIRKMTQEQPSQFMPKLERVFQKSGVAFVIMPNLKNCGINGAVKWLGKDKVLLALNDRRKYADVFWFALFHEIRHIFQRKKGHIIISTSSNIGLQSTLDSTELEKDANRFAQDYLLNREKYNDFVANNNFSSMAVRQFALEMNIQPGIIVGRLQREGRISFNQLNGLREKYAIVVAARDKANQ